MLQGHVADTERPRSTTWAFTDLSNGSGGRTRTPNDRARTCCVADYTTPEGLGHRSRSAAGSALELEEAAVADDPPDCDGAGLFDHVTERRSSRDGAGRRRGDVRGETELIGDATDA